MSAIRHFDTGATRDTNLGKFDYSGFTCPLVLERFAAYMHNHRQQADGSLRAADNWKKGIPLPAYAESEWRHHLDFQKAHQGLPAPDIEDSICALIFNLQGYLHELLKAKPPAGVIQHGLAAAYLRDIAERDDDAEAHGVVHVGAQTFTQTEEVIDVTKTAYNPVSQNTGD